MIVKLARKITEYLCRRSVIQASERDIYYFCFEIILSAAMFWGMALLLALVSGQLLESILYLVVFTMMRSVAGGYHAASHGKCLSLSVASFLAFLAVELLMPDAGIGAALGLIAAYAMYVIGRYAPIDHPRNPFTDAERARNRKHSLRYLALLLGGFLLLTVAGQRHLAFCAALGLFQAAAALHHAVHIKQGGEEHENSMAESADFVG